MSEKLTPAMLRWQSKYQTFGMAEGDAFATAWEAERTDCGERLERSGHDHKELSERIEALERVVEAVENRPVQGWIGPDIDDMIAAYKREFGDE